MKTDECIGILKNMQKSATDKEEEALKMAIKQLEAVTSLMNEIGAAIKDGLKSGARGVKIDLCPPSLRGAKRRSNPEG